MTNKAFTYIRNNQPAFTPVGSDMVVVETAGGANTRVITIDELSNLMNGQTTIQRRTDAWSGAVLTAYGTAVGGAPATEYANTPTLPVSWGQATIDTDGFYSGGLITRLTIPAGVTRARLSFCLYFNTATSNGDMTASITKNGAVDRGVATTKYYNGDETLDLVSPVIDVVEGDYFEVLLNTHTASNLSHWIFTDPCTFFMIEAIERLT